MVWFEQRPACWPSAFSAKSTVKSDPFPCNRAKSSGSLRELVKQSIVTLDMEGVLTPEVWIAVAKHTGVPALRRTTRDEPDYDKLMHDRIDLMASHGITLSKI